MSSDDDFLKIRQFHLQLTIIVHKLMNKEELSPMQKKVYKVLQTLLPVYEKAVHFDKLTIDNALNPQEQKVDAKPVQNVYVPPAKQEKTVYVPPTSTQTTYYSNNWTNNYTSYDRRKNVDPPPDPEGDGIVEKMTKEQIDILRKLVMSQSIAPENLEEANLEEDEEDDFSDEYYSGNVSSETNSSDEEQRQSDFPNSFCVPSYIS